MSPTFRKIPSLFADDSREPMRPTPAAAPAQRMRPTPAAAPSAPRNSEPGGRTAGDHASGSPTAVAPCAPRAEASPEVDRASADSGDREAPGQRRDAFSDRASAGGRQLVQEASAAPGSERSTRSESAEADASVERVAVIAALGYSEREARFLARVASVGGYFVRRQFAEATGLARGRADLSFARRLVERRHATVQTFCRTEQVYHLSMRSMYEGLGEAPKSTRRSRPALAIKGRLMALDVVIARPDIELAVTESARLALCTRHGIDRARIPQRRYRPYRSAAPVTRFFPHAGLVGEIRSASREAGTVVFVYIDDGARSRSGFDTYLRHHAQLLAALPVWRVIYVAESARQATHAARIFARAFGELAGESREQMRADLGEYFRLRQLYDGGRWEALDTSRLERFFDLRNRFGASVEPLFAAWQLRGDDALSERSHEALRPSRDRFETLILPHSYAAVEGVRGLR